MSPEEERKALLAAARDQGPGSPAEGGLVVAYDHYLRWAAKKWAPPDRQWPFEDTLQELRIETLEAVRRFEEHRNVSFNTWLAFRLRGRCTKIWRQMRLKGYQHEAAINECPYSLVSLDVAINAAEDLLGDFIADPTDLELVVAVSWLRDYARQYLNPKEFSVINYRYWLGLSQTDTARRLGISQMHVSRLEARAIKALRAVWEAQE